MDIKPQEISALIKEQIKDFDYDSKSSDLGRVIQVGDGIALVYGLDNVMAGELLLFNNDIYGMVLNLETDHVGVVLMGNDRLIKEGDEVSRTKHIVEVGVGDKLLGRVINSLGQVIDGGDTIEYDKFRPIERVAPGVMTRQSVNQPLHTGIKIIDSMIPIGKGQRELIIGDRQTGKTAIAIDTIINQKGKDVYCVYVAIGQKASTVAQIQEKLIQHNAMEYTVIVSATAAQQAPLQYIAPYTGCAIAEEWMEQGKDVLIIYDDLSKHAVAYRTISLLLRRPAGREAYPGDVFYLHSRLLERSAKLNENYGGGSMTALPIIETQAGDISAYIPTNVISITDGQLYLMSDMFNSGIRPAVDSGMSVSRVGSAAQTKAMKQVSGSLKLNLAQYSEMQSFAQFGSDVDKATQKVLSQGERLTELLKQNQYSPLPQALIVLSLFLHRYDYLSDIPVDHVSRFEKFVHQQFTENHQEILDNIDENNVLSDEIIQQMKDILDKVLERYLRQNGLINDGE